jgi:hypothetical protein
MGVNDFIAAMQALSREEALILIDMIKTSAGPSSAQSVRGVNHRRHQSD